MEEDVAAPNTPSSPMKTINGFDCPCHSMSEFLQMRNHWVWQGYGVGRLIPVKSNQYSCQAFNSCVLLGGFVRNVACLN
jgi:hypothetical protein